MSVPDTPDYQRGVVAAQQLLGSFIGTAATETVTVPANVEALLILVGPVPDPIIEITGVASGVIYPSYTFWTEDDAGIFNLATVVVVAAQVDTEVQVKWGTAPGRPWWVLADTAGRFTFDAPTVAATAKGGQNAPLDALQVAGSDGTDLRVLLTDATGRLQVTGAAFPPVYAAPGTAAPADALQVGGTDGANLRALLVDGSGHALTIDQTLKLAIAALGGALPADAVLVAGSDGTDLRALLTDATGHPLTIDQNLKLAIAAVAAATPADVVQVGGSDATHLRAFLTDVNGRLYTIDFNLQNAIGFPSLPAPNDAVQVGGSDGTDLRALRTDRQGIPYGIGSAPNTATGDRPPNELLFASINSSANGGVLVAAPGAGKAIRIFRIVVVANPTSSGTAFANVVDDTSAAIFVAAAAGTTFGQVADLAGYPSGILMTANHGIKVMNGGLANFYTVSLVYTVDTI